MADNVIKIIAGLIVVGVAIKALIKYENKVYRIVGYRRQA